MANKTIQTVTIDGNEASAFMITESFYDGINCKVKYSVGSFDPTVAPAGEWTSYKNAYIVVNYDEDTDGDMYEYLLGKITESEGFTVTGEITPPTPE